MSIAIAAKKRVGGDVEKIRAEGMIPAIVYGSGLPSESIMINTRDFEKMYAEAGESTLIDFSIDGGEPVKVLVQDVQFDPVNEKPIHADFHQINMNEEMTAMIELHFIGESQAVKEGGTLLTQMDAVEITCLPKYLVSHIDVNLAVLKTFDDAIHIKDLAFPEGIAANEDGETLIAKVSAPLTEEQLKAMEESAVPATLEEIEVEKKGKKEEEDADAEKKAEPAKK
jgi:large subunit ribosomal protein L25